MASSIHLIIALLGEAAFTLYDAACKGTWHNDILRWHTYSGSCVEAEPCRWVWGQVWTQEVLRFVFREPELIEGQKHRCPMVPTKCVNNWLPFCYAAIVGYIEKALSDHFWKAVSTASIFKDDSTLWENMEPCSACTVEEDDDVLQQKHIWSLACKCNACKVEDDDVFQFLE